LHALEPWSMVPVLLLAIFVSTVKLAGMARFEPGPGIWGYAALTVLLTVLSRVSAHRLWRHAEDLGLVPVSGEGVDPQKPIANCLSCGHVQSMPKEAGDDGSEPFFSGPWRCERCGAPVYERKPASDSRTWAFIAAAALLYIPSNVLPVMHIRTAVSDGSYTILGGVRDLWNANSEGLAVIVFVASVVVPLTKLLA